MELLSVIVPVYNAEKYLSRCIESILKQDYKNIELILVNDGSTDASGEICDKYASTDARVVVIHKENGGVSVARNTAMEVASGDYMMFIDSDDEIADGFFTAAMSHMQGVELYISGIKMIYKSQSEIVREEEYKIASSQVMTMAKLFAEVGKSYPPICICGPCCKIYKTDIIRRHGLQFDKSLSLGEDTMFNLSYCERIHSAYFDDGVYYLYYRENEGSLFSKYREDIYEIHERVYDEWRRVINELGVDKEGRARFENMYLNLMIGCIHHVYRSTKDKWQRKEIVRKVLNNEWVHKNRTREGKALTRLISFMVTRKMSLMVKLLFAIKY